MPTIPTSENFLVTRAVQKTLGLGLENPVRTVSQECLAEIVDSSSTQWNQDVAPTRLFSFTVLSLIHGCQWVGFFFSFSRSWFNLLFLIKHIFIHSPRTYHVCIILVLFCRVSWTSVFYVHCGSQARERSSPRWRPTRARAGGRLRPLADWPVAQDFVSRPASSRRKAARRQFPASPEVRRRRFVALGSFRFVAQTKDLKMVVWLVFPCLTACTKVKFIPCAKAAWISKNMIHCPFVLKWKSQNGR